MAERTTAPTGSSIPARLRIVGWILFATLLAFVAVVVTVRSALLTDVERNSNADVSQEVDELRTFASQGLDPQTAQPFASAERLVRLVRLHLQRQYPGRNEVLLGWDRALQDGPGSPLLAQEVREVLPLVENADLLRELFTADETSGVAPSSAGPLRWGRVDVRTGPQDPGASFLVAELSRAATGEVDRITRLMALVCLGGLVATAGLAWLVAGQILAPVRQVRRAAARITQADLSRRIEVRGRDDVAALALTFNAMLDRLEQSFTAQQRFTREASSHLRAPLSVLEEHVDDAATGPAGDALHRMRTILEDLAVLADAEQPGFVRPAPVDLADLTDLLAADARRSTGRPWEVVDRATGTALLDGPRLREAVSRLVRNADTYAPADEPVRLGSRVEDGRVVLWVADGGPGLRAEEAERVFERFTRVEVADDHEQSGPGLGLAVVKAVADGHDGAAFVESEPGRGATFGLELPLRTPSALVAREHDRDEAGRTDADRDDREPVLR